MIFRIALTSNQAKTTILLQHSAIATITQFVGLITQAGYLQDQTDPPFDQD
jgi:hypothetical protein